MRKALAVAVIAVASLWVAGPASAKAFGPPPQAPIVTCTTITFDPPPVSWIRAGISGTVNGASFAMNAKYGSPVPHMATFDSTGILSGTGGLHIVVRPNWSLGPGQGPVTDITLTCHDVVLGGTGPIGSGPGGITGLPFTGGWSQAIAFYGGIALGLGTILASVKQRKLI